MSGKVFRYKEGQKKIRRKKIQGFLHSALPFSPYLRWYIAYIMTFTLGMVELMALAIRM